MLLTPIHPQCLNAVSVDTLTPKANVQPTNRNAILVMALVTSPNDVATSLQATGPRDHLMRNHKMRSYPRTVVEMSTTCTTTKIQASPVMSIPWNKMFSSCTVTMTLNCYLYMILVLITLSQRVLGTLDLLLMTKQSISKLTQVPNVMCYHCIYANNLVSIWTRSVKANIPSPHMVEML